MAIEEQLLQIKRMEIYKDEIFVKGKLVLCTSNF